MAQFFKASRPRQDSGKPRQFIIDKLDHQGRGIAREKGKPVFIEGALPGEQVSAKISENKKNYSSARLIKVLTPSELRIPPACPHYGVCGGCNLQHLDGQAQLAQKQQSLVELFARFADTQPESWADSITGSEWGYRRAARFGLQYNKNNKRLGMGFRGKASNTLVDQKVCPVLEPKLESLIDPLKQVLQGLKSKAHLGHCELVLSAQGPVVSLRHLKPLADQDRQSLLTFAQSQQIKMVLLPDSLTQKVLHGEAQSSYWVKDTEIKFAPGDFIQVNNTINEAMVSQALDWLCLEKTDRVLDLFCGLGNFSLPLGKRAGSVVGVEGVEAMVERARLNALNAGLENVEFFHADLSADFTRESWASQPFDKVLLDPARAGALNSMPYLAKLKARKLVYVSCNAATLARDSKELLAQGYKLKRLGLMDMFPHTSHMESMALFELT